MVNDSIDGVLQEAHTMINGDRRVDYGSVKDSFMSIAALWSTYLNKPISCKDVAMMMVLFKVSRHKTGNGKRDNLVDICGYAALAENFLPENNIGVLSEKEFEEKCKIHQDALRRSKELESNSEANNSDAVV